MSVLIEAVNVLVRRESLEATYPGGTAAYEAHCPNATYCADDHLTRIAFMDPADAMVFMHRLEAASGLRFRDGEPCVDVLVAVQGMGPVEPCAWAEFGTHQDGFPICWLAGTEPGEAALPRNWTVEDHRSMQRFDSIDDADRRIVEVGADVESQDPNGDGGDVLYIGRVYPRSP